MSQIYRTIQGDTVDRIAWKQYGNQNPGTVEEELRLNPALSDYDDILPAGLLVVLPEKTVESRPVKSVNLWN